MTATTHEATAASVGSTDGGGRWPAWAGRATRGLVGVVVFLLLLQVLGWAGVISRAVLPLTSSVLWRTILLTGNGQFMSDLGATVEAWAVGLAITVAVGVPLGVLLGSLAGVRIATRAIIEFLRPIPSVALILLVSLLLGPGLRMSATLIIYGAIWPVLYNTITGIDEVDPVAMETHRAFGFSRLQAVWMVSLPSAAPFIATGIRLASTVALILDIATGYITGAINGPGIGAYISQESTGSNDLTIILAATVWAGILGLVLDLLMTTAQRRLLRWHHLRLGETE
jgi:NitT/TauT family transport system permease protein